MVFMRQEILSKFIKKGLYIYFTYLICKYAINNNKYDCLIFDNLNSYLVIMLNISIDNQSKQIHKTNNFRNLSCL